VTPELEAKLSALLDGELPPEEAAALREEIARRPELEAKLAELSAVDEGLRALPVRPVPAELQARLEERIRAERRAQPRSPEAGRRAPPRAPRSGATPGWRRRWPAAALAAAAVLALVLLVQLRRGEVQVAQTGPAPTLPVEPAPGLQPLPEDRLDPGREAADVALAEDLPVIEVLDVLAELDELEGAGSG
jgi:anti-sigma factor RsiW